MKAIVVTDQAAGTAGMKLVERPEPTAAINDVLVHLAPLPGDVDFTVGASVAMPGLTAWQGLFERGRLQPGQSVLAHGAGRSGVDGDAART